MVTSVSTDRGRRQRLQSKSHIHAPAPISVLPCQIPEPGTFPTRFRLQEQGKEKTRRENYPLIFPCRCLACKRLSTERGADFFSEAIFFSFPHQMAGLRTLFNPIKDEPFKHARGVKDEV